MGRDDEWSAVGLSFVTLLQHVSVHTNQKEKHLDYFLELLHHHKPQINYDTLPSSGKQLLRIDGRDFLDLTTESESQSAREEDEPAEDDGNFLTVLMSNNF